MSYEINNFFLLFYQSFPAGAGRVERRINVPDYVAHSTMTKEDALKQQNLPLEDVPLRYLVTEKPRVPSSLQGQSLFRVHLIQCQTSRLVPDVHQQLQMGLGAAPDFLRSLKEAYASYWGSVGVPDHVQQFYSDLCCCWDFAYLMKHPPRPEQREAV